MRIFHENELTSVIEAIKSLSSTAANNAKTSANSADLFASKTAATINMARVALSEATKSANNLFSDFSIDNPIDTNSKLYIASEAFLQNVPPQMQYENGIICNQPIISYSVVTNNKSITAEVDILSSTGEITYLTEPEEMLLGDMWVGQIITSEEINVIPDWLPSGVFRTKNSPGATIALHVSLSNICNFNEIFINPFMSFNIFGILIHGENGKSVNILSSDEFIHVTSPTVIHIPRHIKYQDNPGDSYGIIGPDGAKASAITIFLNQPEFTYGNNLQETQSINILYDIINYIKTNDMVFQSSKPWADDINEIYNEIKDIAIDLQDLTASGLRKAIAKYIDQTNDDLPTYKYIFGIHQLDIKNSIRKSTGVTLLKPIEADNTVRYIDPDFELMCNDGLEYANSVLTRNVLDDIENILGIRAVISYGIDKSLVKTIKPITEWSILKLTTMTSSPPITIHYTTDKVVSFLSVDDNPWDNPIDPSKDIFVYSKPSLDNNPYALSYLFNVDSFDNILQTYMVETTIDFSNMVTDYSTTGVVPRSYTYTIGEGDNTTQIGIKYIPDTGNSSTKNIVLSTYSTNQHRYMRLSFFLDYDITDTARVSVYNIDTNGSVNKLPISAQSQSGKVIGLNCIVDSISPNIVYAIIEYLDANNKVVATIKTPEVYASRGTRYELTFNTPNKNRKTTTDFYCTTGSRFNLKIAKLGNHLIVYINNKRVGGTYLASLYDVVKSPLLMPNNSATPISKAVYTDDVLSSVYSMDANIIIIPSISPNITEEFTNIPSSNIITLSNHVYIDTTLLQDTGKNPNELFGDSPHPLGIEIFDQSGNLFAPMDHNAESYYTTANNVTIPVDNMTTLIKSSDSSFSFPHSNIDKMSLVLNVKVGLQSGTQAGNSIITNLKSTNIPEDGKSYVNIYISGNKPIEFEPYSTNYTIDFQAGVVVFTDNFISKVNGIIDVSASYTFSGSKIVSIQRNIPYTRNITNYLGSVQQPITPYSPDYPVYEYIHSGNTIRFGQTIPRGFVVKVHYCSYGSNIRIGFITKERNAYIGSVGLNVSTERQYKL